MNKRIKDSTNVIARRNDEAISQVQGSDCRATLAMTGGYTANDGMGAILEMYYGKSEK